jgi:hypothetical protein
MNIRERLREVPGSYDYFVNSTARWMEKDDNIRDDIINQLERRPDSNTKDIMNILCNHLGIGNPIELVDENEYEDSKAKSLMTAGII